MFDWFRIFERNIIILFTEFKIKIALFLYLVVKLNKFVSLRRESMIFRPLCEFCLFICIFVKVAVILQ